MRPKVMNPPRQERTQSLPWKSRWGEAANPSEMLTHPPSWQSAKCRLKTFLKLSQMIECLKWLNHWKDLSPRIGLCGCLIDMPDIWAQYRVKHGHHSDELCWVLEGRGSLHLNWIEGGQWYLLSYRSVPPCSCHKQEMCTGQQLPQTRDAHETNKRCALNKQEMCMRQLRDAHEIIQRCARDN